MSVRLQHCGCWGHLLLLGELAGGARHVGGRIVELGGVLGRVAGPRPLVQLPRPLQLLHAGAVAVHRGGAVPQQRDVVTATQHRDNLPCQELLCPHFVPGDFKQLPILLSQESIPCQQPPPLASTVQVSLGLGAGRGGVGNLAGEGAPETVHTSVQGHSFPLL